MPFAITPFDPSRTVGRSAVRTRALRPLLTAAALALLVAGCANDKPRSPPRFGDDTKSFSSGSVQDACQRYVHGRGMKFVGFGDERQLGDPYTELDITVEDPDNGRLKRVCVYNRRTKEVGMR